MRDANKQENKITSPAFLSADSKLLGSSTNDSQQNSVLASDFFENNVPDREQRIKTIIVLCIKLSLVPKYS